MYTHILEASGFSLFFLKEVPFTISFSSELWENAWKSLSPVQCPKLRITQWGRERRRDYYSNKNFSILLVKQKKTERRSRREKKLLYSGRLGGGLARYLAVLTTPTTTLLSCTPDSLRSQENFHPSRPCHWPKASFRRKAKNNLTRCNLIAAPN